MPNSSMDHSGRRARAAATSRAAGVGALLVAPGSDLTYLTGYRIFSSERLTCLVLGSDGAATLVLPELEAPPAPAIPPAPAPPPSTHPADPSPLAPSPSP